MPILMPLGETPARGEAVSASLFSTRRRDARDTFSHTLLCGLPASALLAAELFWPQRDWRLGYETDSSPLARMRRQRTGLKDCSRRPRAVGVRPAAG